MTEPIITSAENKELDVNDDDRNGREFDCEGFYIIKGNKKPFLISQNCIKRSAN